MHVKSEKKDISRLTYDESGKVIAIYDKKTAPISLPPGFKGVNGEKITVLGRFMFVNQPDGFPLLVAQYPDIIGMSHLSINEVLTITQRTRLVEGGYMRCDPSGQLYCEKIELPKRRIPSDMTRIENRHFVIAYDDNYSAYARGKCFQMPINKGTVKVASSHGMVAVVCCDQVVLFNNQFEIQKHYEWGIKDELRDVKFSQDGLMLHVAYKNTLLTFDLD